jgi:hypothetical protein
MTHPGTLLTPPRTLTTYQDDRLLMIADTLYRQAHGQHKQKSCSLRLVKNTCEGAYPFRVIHRWVGPISVVFKTKTNSAMLQITQFCIFCNGTISATLQTPQCNKLRNVTNFAMLQTPNCNVRILMCNILTLTCWRTKTGDPPPPPLPGGTT